MRRLMSFDTRVTLRRGCACARCITTARMWLSALPRQVVGSPVVIASVCKNSRPVCALPDFSAGGMP